MSLNIRCERSTGRLDFYVHPEFEDLYRQAEPMAPKPEADAIFLHYIRAVAGERGA